MNDQTKLPLLGARPERASPSPAPVSFVRPIDGLTLHRILDRRPLSPAERMAANDRYARVTPSITRHDAFFIIGGAVAAMLVGGLIGLLQGTWSF